MSNQESSKRKKIAFFSMVPPSDNARIETMLGYANAAAAMDYETLIFFYLDGVLIGKQQVFEKLDQKIKSRVREAIDNGVMLRICSLAAQTFGIDRSNLVSGFEIVGIAYFFAYAEDADILLSWS
ncbi:MAG: DsrE family protein, partial [Thermoplasmatales archaeon]